MKKRFLSILLTLCMLLTFLPLSPLTATAADFSGYTALRNASDLSGGLAAGKYYLENDITVSDTITVTGEVTLNLNQHTLSMSSSKPVFYLNYGAIFNLYDASEYNLGTIQGGSANNIELGSAGCIYGHQYTFNMYGGTIKNCSTDKEKSAGGVLVGLVATFNMYGGVIESCTTSAQKSAGGVYIMKSGKFNMSGGTVKSCSTTANYSAGGVYVSNEDNGQSADSVFNLSGTGMISQCNANAPTNDLTYCIGCVGGVYNCCKFNMTGGTIQSCVLEGTDGSKSPVHGIGSVGTCSYNAAGIYNDKDGIFTIEGGEMKYCHVRKDNHDSQPESVGLGNAGTVYAHGGYVYGLYQFLDGTITKKASVTNDTEFDMSSTNYGKIETGQFSDLLTNNGIISGGTYSNVKNTSAFIIGGSIYGGVFNEPVTNDCRIYDGTFNSDVTNNGYIHGGTFTTTSNVDSSNDNSLVSGGEFKGTTKNIYTVKFYVDGNLTQTQWRKAVEATRPSDPVESGKKFVGWCENNATDAFDFDNEDINRDVVLYANWKDQASVSREPTVKETLTYTGKQQLLIESGASSSNGTVMYQVVTANSSLDDSKWTDDTTDISAKDVGSYSVWYYVKGDDDHSDSEPKCIATATIQIAENTWTTEPAISGWTYGQSANVPVAESKFGTVKVSYTGTPNDGNSYSGTVAPTQAGTYKATFTVESTDNYSELQKSVNFVIARADQTAPTGLVSTAETVDGKDDGKISGVSNLMEYRKADKTTYTAITGTELTDLADGTYYIRFSETDNYNASSDCEVVIKTDKKLTVTVPEIQVGYILTVNKTKLVWNDSVELTYELKAGYTECEGFAVKVNGKPVTLNNGKYTVTDVQSGITVTVEGVADITAPTAEIKLGTNKWNQFWNNVTFGLFFKDTQKVTITADDKGSRLNKVYYYLSTAPLTEEQVKALADDKWTEYTGEFNLNPQDEYIIYAKATDKANNTKYISSKQGILIDAIAPVVEDITDGEKCYGNTTFAVTDKHLDKVEVDGNKVTLTDGKYTIKADGKEHTVIATDKSGNASAKIKIKVITIASLDDSIENITTENVKSSDEKAIEDVQSFVNSLITGGKTFTATEQAELNTIKSNTETLLKKIADVSAEMNDLTTGVNAYDIDKVKSDDKETINGLIARIVTLLNGNNLTADEKTTMSNLKATAQGLVKRIDDTANKVSDLTGKVNAYDKDTVKSTDKDTINGLIADMNTLINGNNLNDTEKTNLGNVKPIAENLIKKIDATAKKVTDLTDKINAYDKDKVTSEDKQDITDLITDIEKMLEADNLNDSEKEELGKLKDTANALVDRIEDAASSTDTDNTDKVKDITSDNVKTEDKKELEKAKDDLEKALTNYKDNLTDDEKKDIQDEIDRIEKALELIDNVDKVEDLINKLPSNIKKSDADAIQAADNGNIWMWFALLFVSGGGLLGTTAYIRKRKETEN